MIEDLRNTVDIWIPSLQRNMSFLELNGFQEKKLMTSISDGDGPEFAIASNKIIQKNCQENYNIYSLTIIDKFIILLYLRAASIDDILKLTHKCPSCGKSTTAVYSIKQLTNEKLQKFDRSFETVFNYEDSLEIVAVCDIPTVGGEEKYLKSNADSPLSQTPIDTFFWDMLWTLKYIQFGENKIFTNDLNISDLSQLLNQLPLKLTNDLKKYNSIISKELELVDFFVIECENPKCGKTFNYSIGLKELYFLSKTLFQGNILNIYGTLPSLKQFGISDMLALSMSPAERNYIHNEIMAEKKKFENMEENQKPLISKMAERNFLDPATEE